MNLALDRRPLIVALAGPNGAGKTTFYHAHLQPAGLRFVNADVLAQDLHIEPYAAARVADAVRHELVKQRESFVFETVFSDPSARSSPSSRAWSKRATTRFCALSGLPGRRCANNALRRGVSQGGHDVPTEKLVERFPRILANLQAIVSELPNVLVFDNNDLQMPYRLVAVFESGPLVKLQRPIPKWLIPLIPKS